MNQFDSKQLIDLAKLSKLESGGFGWLGDSGQVLRSEPLEAWINFRMTYIFALEVIKGNVAQETYLNHGLRALNQFFFDQEYGGYHSSASAKREIAGEKNAYEFAFALLALSAAKRAKIQGVSKDFRNALNIFEKYFWDEQFGLVNESWDREFKTLNTYRGLNSNMHSVEAFLELYKSTSDRVWLTRALRICNFAFESSKETKIGLIPEHFQENWQIDFEHNIQNPGDPFKPFGIIIGHQFEWSRLAVELSVTLGESAPAWLVENAARIYQSAKAFGWHADDSDGFIYTVDFEGKCVVDLRMHWVIIEAISCAWTLYKLTNSATYLKDFEGWVEYAKRNFLDPTNASWRHELDAKNRPSSTVWLGRPDVYHAYLMYTSLN
jgi:mannose/cellobiose epimerase-like protein (N-acyl-D-glucosamine 2-epimerase family)